jgi:hypothetical protein
LGTSGIEVRLDSPESLERESALGTASIMGRRN